MARKSALRKLKPGALELVAEVAFGGQHIIIEREGKSTGGHGEHRGESGIPGTTGPCFIAPSQGRFLSSGRSVEGYSDEEMDKIEIDDNLRDRRKRYRSVLLTWSRNVSAGHRYFK